MRLWPCKRRRRPDTRRAGAEVGVELAAARRELAAARQRLREDRARTDEVREIAAKLRRLRGQNEFSAMIDQALRGGG